MSLEKGNGLDVLIVGAGMYACGKGTDSHGTILPALFEGFRQGMVSRIHIAATSRQSAEKALAKAEELKKIQQVVPEIMVYPVTTERNNQAYLQPLTTNKGPWAAVVSVPDHLHFEISKSLMERGVHIQVVKPLVTTVGETRELIKIKEANKVHGVVEFHKRFDEANLKLLDLIRRGELGELLNFRINYSQRKVIPTKMFQAWVDTTNVFQYLGVHYVDLVHFLTDAQPVRVMSIGAKKYLAGQGIDNYDTIQTLIEWQPKEKNECFLSSHLTGWIDPDTTTAMSDQRIEVIGTKGRYRSDQKDRGVTLVTDTDRVEQINPYFTQFYPSLDGKGMRVNGYGPRSVLQFIRDVAGIVNEDRQIAELKGLRATFASSLPVAAVLEASEQSLVEDNRWVKTYE